MRTVISQGVHSHELRRQRGSGELSNRRRSCPLLAPPDVCRQLGVSEVTFYIWKKKYAHLGVSELREMRSLEDETARLKKVVADLSLDKHILTEALRKKRLRPTQRRELAAWVQTTLAVSCVRVCHLAQFSRVIDARRTSRPAVTHSGVRARAPTLRLLADLGLAASRGMARE